MALKLSLKPSEKVAINGAVIVNGERRIEFMIENQARILRERDIMQPKDADTPAKRIYLPIMMMYLDPTGGADLQKDYEARLTEFTGAVSDQEALGTCVKLAAHVANGEHYKALTLCRVLIEFERTRLSYVA